jgi:hypothetical protein
VLLIRSRNSSRHHGGQQRSRVGGQLLDDRAVDPQPSCSNAVSPVVLRILGCLTTWRDDRSVVDCPAVLGRDVHAPDQHEGRAGPVAESAAGREADAERVFREAAAAGHLYALRGLAKWLRGQPGRRPTSRRPSGRRPRPATRSRWTSWRSGWLIGRGGGPRPTGYAATGLDAHGRTVAAGPE